jgi:hypothetical protein
MADDDDGSAAVHEEMNRQDMYPANCNGGGGYWRCEPQPEKKWKKPSAFRIATAIGLAVVAGYLTATSTYNYCNERNPDPHLETMEYIHQLGNACKGNHNRAGLVGIIAAGSAMFAGFRLFRKREE